MRTCSVRKRMKGGETVVFPVVTPDSSLPDPPVSGGQAESTGRMFASPLLLL